MADSKTWICPICEKKNSNNDDYCVNCGVHRPINSENYCINHDCERYGQPLDPTQKYCGKCGQLTSVGKKIDGLT